MTCCCGVVAPGVLNTNRPGLDAETITELVHNAGGNTNALFRVSLAWDSWSDVDLHLNEPNREHIFFSHRISADTGGTLDVDMNVGSTTMNTNSRTVSKPAVENIMYTDLSRMPDGIYKISYVQFGVNNERAEGADAPYLLIENRTENEAKMSHYVLLKYNGANADKNVEKQIPLADVRKEGDSFILERLAPDVTILNNHNFNLGSYSVSGGSTPSSTENSALTGENPTEV